MRNISRPKPRKIVEISFDPESQAQFPKLATKKNHQQNQNNQKHKSTEDSPASSHSDSVSAVTRAEFETLSQAIGQMIKNEVQSTLSTSIDQTMMTMIRDEMAANRIESQKQMEMIQTQMTSFQNLINGIMMPHLTNSLANSPTSTTASNPTQHPNIDPILETQDDEPTDEKSDTPTTQPDEAVPPTDKHDEPESPPRIKNVSINDQKMPNPISHNVPSASGDTPPPKRRSAGLNLSRRTPLIANTRSNTGHIIFPPTNPNSTTIGNKANGGAS
jgi:hypothetical protein